MNLRKIDALIAERVLGLRVVDHGFNRFTEPGERAGEQIPVRNYSTDIAAAWEVVERLSAFGFATVHRFDDTTIHPPLKKYSVEVSIRQGMGRSVANTAPLAICLAALKAIDVEDKEYA